jgi:CheY-like chemotaxis protein
MLRGDHCDVCAIPMGSPKPIEVGTLLDGRYRVDGVFGTGGMGAVLRAFDVHLEREVAIKIVRASLHGDPSHVQRFRREAATMARLKSPHLAAVHAFGVHGDATFFAMESVVGSTLADILLDYQRAQAHLPVGRTVEIVSAVAQALAVAHSAGIVHRDIKTDNVLIEADSGRVVLVDFGVAYDGSVDAGDGRVWGTAQYLAPELAADPTPSPATDQYALGILAYEALTGQVPFDGGDDWAVLLMHRDLPVPRVARERPELRAHEAVLSRALAKDPAVRYPTCVAFARALEEAHRGTHQGKGERPAVAVARPSRAPEGALHVLVVDDDALFVRMATRCVEVALEGVPATLTQATSASLALAQCEARMPDLIVLDYMMPELDGVELLSRIRALPNGTLARTLVVSGAVEEEARWRFSALGVRTFAKKPIDFPELVGTIHGLAVQNGWIASRGTTPS